MKNKIFSTSLAIPKQYYREKRVITSKYHKSILSRSTNSVENQRTLAGPNQWQGVGAKLFLSQTRTLTYLEHDLFY
jgi:hypothetical protein